MQFINLLMASFRNGGCCIEWCFKQSTIVRTDLFIFFFLRGIIGLCVGSAVMREYSCLEI